MKREGQLENEDTEEQSSQLEEKRITINSLKNNKSADSDRVVTKSNNNMYLNNWTVCTMGQ